TCSFAEHTASSIYRTPSHHCFRGAGLALCPMCTAVYAAGEHVLGITRVLPSFAVPSHTRAFLGDAVTELVKDLFDLPVQVTKSDFVLELTSGVADPKRTASTYVVTDRLKDAFDRGLKLISSALSDSRSKATYLHGSFGSGKSH